jgi:hypothetical protein
MGPRRRKMITAWRRTDAIALPVLFCRVFGIPIGGR